MTARDLLSLLAERHKDDVFVPECKTGPSWMGEHIRLDAWAMRRSWAKACVWGYEIKVSRSDFAGDTKWHGGIRTCNEFSFVCPPGLIRAEELPAEVGLLYAAAGGRRLVTKRKALHRVVAVPDALYRYLLMNRVVVDRPNRVDPAAENPVEYWRAWLRQREDDRKVGHLVGQKLRQKYDKDVTQVRARQEELERRLQGMAQVKELVEKLGLSDYDGWYASAVENRIERLKRLVPPHTIEELRRLARDSRALADDLERAAKGEAL